MGLEKELLNTYFIDEVKPNWKCPKCKKGVLKIGKIKIVNEEVLEGKHHDEVEGFRSKFATILTCSTSNCNCKPILTGNYLIDYEWLQTSEDYGPELTGHYYPKYFNPPIHLFEIQDEFSHLEEYIEEMFSLYWTNKSACGNAMRKVVEEILSDKKIKKTETKNGKRIVLWLNKRLKLFKDKNPEATEYLEAIKFIGDQGSHKYEVDEDELIEGLELLEHALETIYCESKQERMKKLAKKKINRYKK